LQLGEPLLFQLFSYLTVGPLPEGQDVMLHPMAYAGWVGIFITALNLMPIGQLDGGHVLYALLRQRAHVVSLSVLAAAAIGMVLLQYWSWMLMIVLLAMLGVRHPPTQNDDVPLGIIRTIMGWLALAFVIVGFTPTPVIFGK
jgi:membrane-associated protease RseP (regulator of RpoE activity)